MADQPPDLRAHEQAILRHRVAFAESNSAGHGEATHFREQVVAITGRADEAQQLEQVGRACGSPAAAQRAAQLEESANQQRCQRARWSAQVRRPDIELGSEPTRELGGARGLAGAIAAQERHQAATAREPQAARAWENPQPATDAQRKEDW